MDVLNPSSFRKLLCWAKMLALDSTEGLPLMLWWRGAVRWALLYWWTACFHWVLIESLVVCCWDFEVPHASGILIQAHRTGFQKDFSFWTQCFWRKSQHMTKGKKSNRQNPQILNRQNHRPFGLLGLLHQCFNSFSLVILVFYSTVSSLQRHLTCPAG